MELLAPLLVGKPLNILVVAVVFFVGYLALRFRALGLTRHPRLLLIAATAGGFMRHGSGLFKSRLRKRTSGSTFS